MKAYYDVLLLGASALAAGFAAGHPDLSCVVLESGCICASEFAAAFRTDGDAPAQEPKTAAGRAFRKDAIRRGALGENSEWMPAASPLTAQSFRDSRTDCCFMTALTDIKELPEGFAVTFTAFGSAHSFAVGRIIDTTTHFLSHAFVGKDAPDYQAALNYYLCTDGEPAAHALSCKTIAEGRAKLLEKLENGTEKLYTAAWELSVSPAFDGDYVNASRFCWKPSAACGNFLWAFECGAGLALTDEKPAVMTPATVDEGEYDVAVVGLGTAGAIATWTAAKQGLKVLGLENLSVMGGAGTAGGVQGYYYGFKGGLYTQIDNDAKSRTEQFASAGAVGSHQKSMLLERYNKTENADCRLNAPFTGLIMPDAKHVTGVTWMENGVPHKASTKFVIDCTAESSVCVASGTEMVGGRASDGQLQPYSSVWYRFSNGTLSNGYIDNGTINQYDPDDFGRETLLSGTSFPHLRENYADHDFWGTAPLIGMREGRKIVGEENIAFRKMIDGDFCRKPVYYGNSNMDNHGKDSVLESRDYQDWNTICGLWGWGISIPVPMGALIPKGMDGLLAAGRNVADDHDLSMGLRMKDDAQKSAETAAKIASLAIRHGIPAREVSYDEIVPMLYESGCLKDGDRILLEKQKAQAFFEEPLWCYDEEKLAAGISGDEPGYYLWSCRYKDYSATLYRILREGGDTARRNAALALALTDHDDAETVDALIDTALEKTGYIPHSGRKYVTLRAVSAISALGRIKAEKAVEPLFSVLENNAYLDELPFEPYMFINDREDLHYQFESTAIASLCEIAQGNPTLKAAIKARLLPIVRNNRYLVSLMGNIGFKKDVTASIRGLVEKL